LNAYVSASSRGLAFEIARELAAGGANVALSSRDASHLDAARAKIAAESPRSRVLTVPADLCRVEDQERVLATLESDGFVPDVFVCSAGHARNLYLSSLSRSDWQCDLEMILGQAVFATQRLAPAMAERGYGRIILLSSISAKTPDCDYFMSSLARAGLFSLSKMVAGDCAGRGVASFVLCLGFIDTPLLRNTALGRPVDAPDPEGVNTASWKAKYEEWAAEIPAKRIASPTELSKLVAFLVSPEAEYLNGTVFSFSGGLDRGLV
jgi:NAD(P)-dependent dehydrogenase (short-subunit alcohol dehydrogenase family)